jgi:hypothetical protein
MYQARDLPAMDKDSFSGRWERGRNTGDHCLNDENEDIRPSGSREWGKASPCGWGASLLDAVASVLWSSGCQV